LAATKRALQASYKVLEIHGAHGYLLHSFLSLLSNKRTDEYGGSFENRIRLATDVATRVRAVWPSDLPLFFRISSVDGTSDGWVIEDSVNLANRLKEIGVDVIDCSSGGIAGSATAAVTGKRQPGFQVPYAEQVRAETDILTMTVGLITHPL
jgi:2,4-dienoyl-CoA reductase-like NADH-dependent reductase (Old Yellow Enzyme family)